MKTSQEQILKALSGLIPEDTQKEVSEAISGFLENAKAELEKEYNTNLEEAFNEHKAELETAKKTAEEGYKQAWEAISDLRDRLELQKEEFDNQLEKGYEQAYQMLQEERSKNDTLEVDLYEEYDRRFSDIKEYVIDKLDQFLQLQDKKYREVAKRDVLNDPATLEHKLAFNKIVETVSDFISDEEYTFATSSKVDSLSKTLEDVKGQLKILESKNMRLSMENTKLTESVRHSQELLNEQVVKSDKKARVEKAGKVEGRGESEPDRQKQKVIAEYKAAEPVVENTEHVSEKLKVVTDGWRHLAGMNKPE